MCGIFREPKDTGLRGSKVTTGFPCVLSHGTPSEMVTSGACGLEQGSWEERASFLLRPHPCRQAWPLASGPRLTQCVCPSGRWSGFLITLALRQGVQAPGFIPSGFPRGSAERGWAPRLHQPCSWGQKPCREFRNGAPWVSFMPSLGLRAWGGGQDSGDQEVSPCPCP